MIRLLICSSLLAVTFAGILHHDGRIIGGEETTIEKFPHQISMMSYSVHVCGGSILNKNFVLTAAHCTDGKKAENLKIRAGSTSSERGGTVIKVTKIIQHEKYNRLSKDNDISILQLAEPLQYSDSIKAVKLTTKQPPEGTKATVSGWGRTDPNVTGGPENLRCVDLNTISTDNCRKMYPNNPVTDRMFCCTSDGKDSCQGDSGGPLISDGVQIGVVSWGIGCGSAKKPGVYAKVTEFLDWIAENSQ